MFKKTALFWNEGIPNILAKTPLGSIHFWDCVLNHNLHLRPFKISFQRQSMKWSFFISTRAEVSFVSTILRNAPGKVQVCYGAKEWCGQVPLLNFKESSKLPKVFLLFHLPPELSQCATAPSDLPLLFMDFLSRIAIFCHKGFSPSIPVGFSSLTLYHRKTALLESVYVLSRVSNGRALTVLRFCSWCSYDLWGFTY